MSTPKTRLAIIGAGPGGLSILRAFALAQADGTEIPEIVCFERQSDWGGLWNYTWRTGLDEFGEVCHGSMYRHLWTNAPKEAHEYPEYSYDKHFGKPLPSFLPRELFRDYLLGRLKDVNIRRYIQFNTAVRYVEFDNEKEQFNVRVQELISGKIIHHNFDHVVVATGHFSVPNMPEFEGIDRFSGRVIHSHDFRDAEQFAGQDILVVGGKISAEDVALQTFKFGAKSVTISYHSRPLGFKCWPHGIEEVPPLVRLAGKTAHFKDGTTRDVDSIIMCTGYQHHFPFLADNLRLVTTNRPYPDQLYKGIVYQDCPRLFYIGMQDVIYTTSVLDLQAWYARDVILGRITIPEKEERTNDIAIWLQRASLIKSLVDEIPFQIGYVEDLLPATACKVLNLRDTLTMGEQWFKDRNEDILGYRNKTYTSIVTGTQAVAPSTPWIDVKSDEDLLKLIESNF